MATQDSRIRIKRSTSPGVTPTIPSSSNHLDGSWLSTDLYIGEFMTNVADKRAWFRASAGLVELQIASPLFANVASREAYAPAFIGQKAYQLDTKLSFVAYGTSAGNWQADRGVLSRDTTPSSVVGASTDMSTFTIPGNTLKQDGDFIEVESYGSVVAAASGNGINILVGSNTIEALGPLNAAGGTGYWIVKAKIIRTGGGTAKVSTIATFSEPSGTDIPNARWESASSVTWSGNVIVKMRTSSGWGASTVQQEAMIISIN